MTFFPLLSRAGATAFWAQGHAILLPLPEEFGANTRKEAGHAHPALEP